MPPGPAGGSRTRRRALNRRPGIAPWGARGLRNLPGIRGSSDNLIGRRGGSFLFAGGYRDNRYVQLKMINGRLSKPKECALVDGGGREPHPRRRCFYKSRAALLEKDGRLFITDWIG